MKHQVNILAVTEDTHETRVLVTEKPEGFDFSPGQATNVALAKENWKDESRPFTMTSLPTDPCLQFTIKTYPERDGVTDEMRNIQAGDQLLLEDPWGAIQYEGPGLFIAGGAGVTPFLAIFRDLHRKGQLFGNVLLYSNEKSEDAIAAGELKTMLGKDCHFFVTDEEHPQFDSRRIDRERLAQHLEQFSNPKVYLCGPPSMMEAITETLKDLGIEDDNLITEDLDS